MIFGSVYEVIFGSVYEVILVPYMNLFWLSIIIMILILISSVCNMCHGSRHTFYLDTSRRHRIEDGAMIMEVLLGNIVLPNISGNKINSRSGFWEIMPQNSVAKFGVMIS